jgi:cytochrome c oxidase subunit 2
LCALAALAVVTSACANEAAPQDVLSPSGQFAREADRLWDIVFPIAVVIFFIVEGLLLYALFRFRRKPGREARQFHGNTRLEIVLTALPALILAGVAVPTVQTIFSQAEEPAGALQVEVEGRQFWWRFEYPELGVVTANELHIPVGQPVRLTIRGFDVIHSFWVPRLAGTIDVVPGRVNHLTIQADEPGEYWGQCKEFCGLSHGNMRLRVIAQSEQDFLAWVSDQQLDAQPPSGAAAQRGLELFQQTCTSCHAVAGLPNTPADDRGLVGPNLTHFSSRRTFAGALLENNDANLRAWLDNPPAIKPGSVMPDYNLTPEQIDDLIAYLRTLE